MSPSGAVWSPEGLYVAFDTSTSFGSVAVAAGAEVLSRRELRRPAGHSSGLIPSIHEVLEEGGVAPAELSGIVVGAGPGSFTGVRVAAATAKGLAHALEIPLWAFSSLEAGAAAVDSRWVPPGDGPRAELSLEERGWPRYVLFDARADRVYAACYLPTGRGLDVLVPPHSTTISELLSGEVPFAVFAGDGTLRHADEIRGSGFPVLPHPLGVPTADALLEILGAAPGRLPVEDAALWEPEYLRPSSAERLAGGP